MSVVAALSERLTHVNRRHDGSWAQHYEHGVPVTDLLHAEADGTTGTTVRFLPDPSVRPVLAAVGNRQVALLTQPWWLAVPGLR